MDKFSNLSPPVRWGLGITAVVGLVGVGLLMGAGKWIFIAVLFVLLVLLLGGFFLYGAWKRKRQSAQFMGDISQHSTASPRGISDPGQRARLDDLRKKFGEGIDAYRSRGKDIYKLPWYAIVGEPGAGKTEAVRHCNIGFPPGMQDEFQGVGGTINMNWWFANNGVLLDTAGRLMFEEVKPGETGEWREFLNLLKRNRPNCPINGLFLVIPSDSLIVDSADAIQKKAGKIAQQLDVIQRVLDVRFPVFVVVTKCDKIKGFREFFDTLSDPQMQHQMLGWSNPDPLDAPFRPELVMQHLDKVVQKMRRRRTALLRDPVPAGLTGRRTDEVDSLYAFPHSLSLLGTRLRRYLETIFVAGEWSAKPLFLRGIYFSSSMREGSALDQDLAEAIGVPVEALPEGQDWERERAFFLRDLFMDKAFPEQNLVTRATNTQTMLRKRQVVFFGVGFVALALFIAVAWLGMRELKTTIGLKSDQWTRMADAGWNNGLWNQAIVLNGAYRDTVILPGERPYSQGQFYSNLVWLVKHPLKENWKFPGLAKSYNRNSLQAGRVVVETGLVKPLTDGVRQKMIRGDTNQFQSAALISLIQLEGDILGQRIQNAARKPVLDYDGAQTFLDNFFGYITGSNMTGNSNLVSSLAWTYSPDGMAANTWPPAWLSGAVGPTNDLQDNPAIAAGLDKFIAVATANIRNQVLSWHRTDDLRTALEGFETAESGLFQATRTEGADTGPAYGNLRSAANRVDKALADSSADPSFKQLLYETYQNFRGAVFTTGTLALNSLKQTNAVLQAQNASCPLFAGISNRLFSVERDLEKEVREMDVSTDTNRLRYLDTNCLAVLPDGRRACAARWAAYSAAEGLGGSNYFSQVNWGHKDEQWQAFSNSFLTPVARAENSYASARGNEMRAITDSLLGASAARQASQFLESYASNTASMLDAKLGFPLSWDHNNSLSPDELSRMGQTLGSLADDAASFAGISTLARGDSQWGYFTNRVQRLVALSASLVDPTGQPIGATVYLGGQSRTREDKDKWRETWRQISLGSAASPTRTGGVEDKSLGEISINDKMQLVLYNDSGEHINFLPDDLGDWGILQCLRRYGPPQRDKKGDNTIWDVDIPVDPGKGGGVLPLKVKFSQALILDPWPK